MSVTPRPLMQESRRQPPQTKRTIVHTHACVCVGVLCCLPSVCVSWVLRISPTIFCSFASPCNAAHSRTRASPRQTSWLGTTRCSPCWKGATMPSRSSRFRRRAYACRSLRIHFPAHPRLREGVACAYFPHEPYCSLQECQIND